MGQLPLRLTGIQEIDHHHSELVAHLDRLSSWHRRGYGLPATFDALEALLGYIEKRFHLEEALMRERAYPSIERHVGEHRAIADKLAELRRQLEAGHDVVHELETMLKAWIVNHVNEADLDYARFFGAVPA